MSDLATVEKGIASLSDRAAAIIVRDQSTYMEACEILKVGRAEIKAIGFALDPGIESARGHLQKLQSDKKMYVSRVETIIKPVEQKAENWKAEERRKAEAEERRINEERRLEAARIAEAERKERERLADEERKRQQKEAEAARKAGEISKREAERLKKEAEAAAEREKIRAAEDAKIAAAQVQEVKVRPSVPTVAGIKQRVNWKFRFVDPGRIPRTYLMPDEVKIGQMVRAEKDKARAEGICPGIEVYTEDSI
jgi:rRNA maturation endonuclease Nob1